MNAPLKHGTRPEDHPSFADLRKKADELGNMLFYPALFAAEEILGQSLAVTRLAFDIAGSGEDETQRRALHDAIADYVDVPSDAPPPPLHLLKELDQ